jgi:hypothetical protein
MEQYNWPSTLNPDFDTAKEIELARLYGGRESPATSIAYSGNTAHQNMVSLIWIDI